MTTVDPTILEHPGPPPSTGLAARFNLSGVAALFGLTVRRLLGGRRLLGIAGLFLLPSLLTLLMRWNGAADDPATVEFFTLLNLIPHAAVPFTALLFASGLIQDEVEEQTLTYLMVRPIPRWVVYLVKLGAAVLTSALVAAACTLVNMAVIRWGQPDPAALAVRALRISAVYSLGLVAYGGIFGLIGLLLRKSLPVGVIYIIFIEGYLSAIPFIIRRGLVVFYERVLMLHWLDLPRARDAAEGWKIDRADMPGAAECVVILLGIGVVAAMVGALVFTLREFRVKTPEAA
jgi:ABC-2 type transport system permease protein